MRQGTAKKKEGSEDEAEMPPPDEKEDSYDDLDESDRIKYNLKNSSNVYYAITHSIQDEVKE